MIATRDKIKCPAFRAKLPGARSETFGAETFASLHAGRGHPIQRRKKPAPLKAARRTASSARERSARSKDRRPSCRASHGADRKREQIFAITRGNVAKRARHPRR